MFVRFFFCLALLAVSVTMLAFVTGNSEWGRSMLPLAGMAILWPSLMLLSPYYTGGKALRQTPGLAGPRTMDISAEGLHVRSATVDSKLAWSLYSRWTETKKAFVLYQGPNIVVPLPKRVMSAEQQETLRGLLNQFVKK